jgi:multisubunit Na+/H+ antiporter MnhF subunit
MRHLDRAFLIAGLAYGAVGMALGLYMAASNIHVQHVTHAHIMLVGFLLSIIYAIIHKLWLAPSTSWVRRLQFGLHHAGTVFMVSGLFLLYQGIASPATLEPVLAISSIAVLVALIMMAGFVLMSYQEFEPQTS